MAFGGFNGRQNSAPVSEINMIPLIDVMLVLLVIFIVTAPLLTHAVKIELPRASSAPNITRPDNVQLAIRADGQIFWNGEAVDDAAVALRFAAAVRADPQPEVHIRAERATRYERVAKVMSAAAITGLTRIGFITEPEER